MIGKAVGEESVCTNVLDNNQESAPMLNIGTSDGMNPLKVMAIALYSTASGSVVM